MNWYVLHTYTGSEIQVKESIEHLATIKDWRGKIGRVVVPTEKVVMQRTTRSRTRQRNLMPGYVFVELEPEEEIFNQIRRLPGVSSFLGPGGKPEPLSQKDVESMLELVESRATKPKKLIKFRKGEQVKVSEGPFSNFIGVIDEIDEEKARLRVLVTIFGRQTPLELEVTQVESL
ncbi:transcription termination/antitermination factor NusG [Candidatus Sumerlaeota bacterium]|nr:transcription termination/antitermination factor NusG [Candidatus Sumerlaeota bacterium]